MLAVPPLPHPHMRRSRGYPRDVRSIRTQGRTPTVTTTNCWRHPRLIFGAVPAIATICRTRAEDLRSAPTVVAAQVRGVSEDEVAVIELHCPSSAGFGDAGVADGNSEAGRVAEVVDNGPSAGLAAVGLHVHAVSHCKAVVIRHAMTVSGAGPRKLSDAAAHGN